MSKIIEHQRQAENNVHLLQRKYLGNGRFYQRGYFKGAEVGDIFSSFTCPKIDLKIDKIISIQDAKSNQFTEEQKKDSYIEMELIYEGFESESKFINRPNCFGN